MRIVAVVLSLVVFTACSSRPVPEGVLAPDQMRPIVYDLIRSDELVNNFLLRDTSLEADEQHIKMYEQVFKIHKTSRDEFYKSLRYYQAHPDVNKLLLDSLLSYANRQQNALHKSADTSVAK
jgi:hypothetical protein